VVIGATVVAGGAAVVAGGATVVAGGAGVVAGGAAVVAGGAAVVAGGAAVVAGGALVFWAHRFVAATIASFNFAEHNENCFCCSTDKTAKAPHKPANCCLGSLCASDTSTFSRSPIC